MRIRGLGCEAKFETDAEAPRALTFVSLIAGNCALAPVCLQHAPVVVPRVEELLLSLLEDVNSEGSSQAEAAAADGSANGGASTGGTAADAPEASSGGGGESIPRWAALLLRLTLKLNR